MILALDSSGTGLDLALGDKAKIVDTDYVEKRLSHSESLIPAITKLLKRNQARLESLTALAGALGPGSFTGIRIGLTTCNALGYALNIPCYGVDTLALMAHYALAHLCHTDLPIDKITAFLDAGRSEVYHCRFTAHELREMSSPPTAAISLLNYEQLNLEITNDPTALVIGKMHTYDAAFALNLQRGKAHANMHLFAGRDIPLSATLVTLTSRVSAGQGFDLNRQLNPLYVREAHITISKKKHL